MYPHMAHWRWVNPTLFFVQFSFGLIPIHEEGDAGNKSHMTLRAGQQGLHGVCYVNPAEG